MKAHMKWATDKWMYEKTQKRTQTNENTDERKKISNRMKK